MVRIADDGPTSVVEQKDAQAHSPVTEVISLDDLFAEKMSSRLQRLVAGEMGILLEESIDEERS